MSSTFSTLYFVLVLPISGFLGVVTLIVMLAITHRLRLRYKDANWTPIAATVEESCITRQVYGHTVVFNPVIKYRYVYGGKQYLSSTISPDLHYPGSRDQSDAQRWVDLFPVNTNVTAYVDKNTPDIAVLFPDFRYGWWYALLVTFAVFGGCNFLLFIIFAAVA